ncbi:MAG: caspase family protein [Pseudonocardiaceae bacterium]
MAGLRYRGLLLGNSTFPRDPHGLAELEGPRADIEALRQALTDPEVGLFDPGDVVPLPDRTVQQLRERLDEFFSTAVRDEVLLLYYSGHGELDTRNTLYLCAQDTRSDILPATALSALEINNMVEGSAAGTIVIVLDCCHSGAFRGGKLTIPVAGRGRYVLTSNRSSQLARDAARPGQPSPFTGLLVHGLRHAPAQGHLTVTELYRQVHRWMTAGTTLAPQLRITGEGEVIIARRANLPPPQPPEPPIEPIPVPGSLWRAQRVRTGGAECVLRVGDGTEEHIVEYRARADHTAVVLLDGKRVHRGHYHVDCEFRLGRRGPLARLTVTGEPDVQLWADGRRLYTLHHADPGSDSFLEHRAHTIRNALLTHQNLGAWLWVTPEIRGRVARAVREPARQGMPPDQVIGVLTLEGDRIGFTDTALSIRGQDSWTIVPYDELLAAAVTVEYSKDYSTSTVRIGDRQFTIKYDSLVVEMINHVKDAVVYEETGLGKPLPAHPLSLVHTTRDQIVAERNLGRAMVGVTVVLFAAAEIVGGFSGFLDQQNAQRTLFSILGVCFASGLLLLPLPDLPDGITRFTRVSTERFSWLLARVATYATAASTWITWLWLWWLHNRPPYPDLQYGWSTRLGGWMTIAIGNNTEVMALGAGARVLGTLLVAAAAFLPVAVVLVAIRWADRPPRPKANNRAYRTRRNPEKQLAVRADRHQPGG